MAQIETERQRPHRPAEKAKEILLSAASSIFAVNGYHNGHIIDVAQQAGYSMPAIYRYFEDKAELAIAVVNRASAIFEESLRLELVGKEDIDARINALLNVEEMLYSCPEGKVFYMLLSGVDNTQLKDSLRQFFEKKKGLYQQIANDDYIAWRVFSAVIGVGMMAIVKGQEVFDDTIAHLRINLKDNVL